MINVDGTIAGLELLAKRVTDATEAIAADAAHVFQERAMEFAPVGMAGNSTNAAGDLARSIHVEGPYGSGGGYVARVGPTVTTANPGPGGVTYNYGRLREFGGTVVPHVSAALVFTKMGQTYTRASVTQVGSHYLLRARLEGMSAVEGRIQVRLTWAVGGA